MLSSRIIQASVGLLRMGLAQPVHDALEHGLDDAQEGSLRGVAVPAGFHQLPALLIKHGKTFRADP